MGFFFPSLIYLFLTCVCMCMCIYTHTYIPFKSKQITALGFCVKVANQGSVYTGRLCKTGARGRIWDGGGGIRRPRAGGFGVFSSAVTSPSSQQSSLQTKFTASGDGTGRAGPGWNGTGPPPAPTPRAPVPSGRVRNCWSSNSGCPKIIIGIVSSLSLPPKRGGRGDKIKKKKKIRAG